MKTLFKRIANITIRLSFMHVQSCLTLCDPVDCSPPGSSIHGIFPARILERVATSSKSACLKINVKSCLCSKKKKKNGSFLDLQIFLENWDLWHV